jgi:hypothetical protein
MDDFRVGSISPVDSYREQPAEANRKKLRPRKDQSPGEDEVVLEHAEAAGEEAEESGVGKDYYTPSDQLKGPE